jgi:peroxiredoxin (alkyl hydroperoxide reductase subunit C)
MLESECARNITQEALFMSDYKALMIGEKAPHFQANTTYGAVNFPEDYKGKWVIFFSHPGDFTPVCTTEIMTFASMAGEFSSRNCALLGLSVDSNPSHIGWSRSMERYQWKNIINPKITFPIIADDFGTVAKLYGMIMPTASATRTVRTVLIIDPEGVIRAMLVYPLTTGRNMMEIMRLLLALQSYDSTGNATPANWMPGEPQLMPSPQTLPAASQRTDEEKKGAYACLDWYVCFTQGMIQTMPNSNAPMNVAGMANSMPKMAAMPEMMNSMPKMAAMPEMMNSMPKTAAMPEMMNSMPKMAAMPEMMNSMPKMAAMPEMMNSMPKMQAMPEMMNSMPKMQTMPEMMNSMPKMQTMPEMMNSMPKMQTMPEMMNSMPNMHTRP